MIASLRPVLDLCSETYYSWALREIDPQHPDLPALVVRLNDLQRRVAGSRTAMGIKATLRPIATAVRRAALAFWRWC